MSFSHVTDVIRHKMRVKKISLLKGIDSLKRYFEAIIF